MPRARLLAVAIVAVGCADATKVRTTTVLAVDYAYRMPDTLPAGPTVFHLKNEGSIRHELLLSMLKKGVSPESGLVVMKSGGDPSLAYEPDAGILVATPGILTKPGLRVDLVAGRTYLIVCTLPDAPNGAPDGKPHVMLGMLKSFVVR